MKPRWICAFCGARTGTSQDHAVTVIEFGQALVRSRLGLVYGGASQGLMGLLADTVLAEGGHVIGVIPQSLVEREIAHPYLTRQLVTESFAERKARMLDLSDAFVVLPGGAGTLDELSELWTAAMLGLHRKPLGILNSGGYFDLLLKFFDHAVAEGFLGEADRALVHVETNPQRLLEWLVPV